MESELEGMLVRGWVQGDQARLLQRIETLERELSHISSEQELERHDFTTQMTNWTRKMAAAEDECQSVLKEVSLRAKGEEKLRRICQRRVQELEAEVILLREQVKAAETKFKITEEALRRQRANEDLDRQNQGPAENESVPRVGNVLRKDSDRHDSAGAASDSIMYSLPSRNTQARSCDLNSLGRSNGQVEKIKEGTDEVKEIKIVERMVAELLKENTRLRNTVKHQKGCCVKRFSRGQPRGLPCEAPWRASQNKLEEGDGNYRLAEPEPKGVTRRRSDMAIPIKECSFRVNSACITNSSDAEGRECDNGQGRRDRASRTAAGGALYNGSNVTDGIMIDGELIDKSKALSKMEAFKGIIRAQEEIEALLYQELGKLKIGTRDCERLWQLLVRWRQVLEGKGYPTEDDIRAAGLSEQLIQRCPVVGTNRDSSS